MKAIVALALRIADLVEAEGRLAKRHALGLGLSLVMIATGACFVVLAFTCLLAGLFLVLIEAMHPTAALFVIGAVFLALAIVGFALARSVYRDNASRAKLKSRSE